VEKINEISGQKKILIAPLDWGLGHTTRCIPLIRFLIDNNCMVQLAANKSQEVLIRSEFPNIEILPLNGTDLKGQCQEFEVGSE
jgi:hypothetical protein